jgi:hypothetical protein
MPSGSRKTNPTTPSPEVVNQSNQYIFVVTSTDGPRYPLCALYGDEESLLQEWPSIQPGTIASVIRSPCTPKVIDGNNWLIYCPIASLND